MAKEPALTMKLFCSYAHADKSFRDDLGKVLDALQHAGYLKYWYDGMIKPGQEWKQEIEHHLNTSQVILLLVSPDFMASGYCQKEMKMALARHQTGEACLIPIIVRTVDWQSSPLSFLQALHADNRPYRRQTDRDQLFAEISAGIRIAIEDFAHRNHLKKDTDSRNTTKGEDARHFVRRKLAGQAETYNIDARLIQGSVLGSNSGMIRNGFDLSELKKFLRKAPDGNDILDE